MISQAVGIQTNWVFRRNHGSGWVSTDFTAPSYQHRLTAWGKVGWIAWGKNMVAYVENCLNHNTKCFQRAFAAVLIIYIKLLMFIS